MPNITEIWHFDVIEWVIKYFKQYKVNNNFVNKIDDCQRMYSDFKTGNFICHSWPLSLIGHSAICVNFAYLCDICKADGQGLLRGKI